MRRMLLVLLTAAAPLPAAEIQHEAVGCVVADRFPRLEVRVVPADGVGRARVSFRPEDGRHWYSVALKPEDGAFVAVLPKPRAKLAGLRYYVEVTDAALQTTRTPEYAAVVASGPAACQDRKVASGLASASVALEVPAGAPGVPAGFSGQGVVAAGSAAGVVAGAAAVTAAGGGAAAAGGGVSTALLVGGGVAAAGAAVVVTQAAGGGGDEGGDCCPTPPQYSVQFGNPPNGIDVSSCAGRPLTWSSQAIPGNQGSLSADGSFDAVWSPGEPNTTRVVGRATETSFTATLSCVSGSGSGSLSASGSGGTYQGQWSFAGRQGNLTVVRR